MFCEEFQTTLLNEHFKVFDYHKNNSILFGELIWNFADFMTDQGKNNLLIFKVDFLFNKINKIFKDVKRVNGNRKGVFTREREPKASAFLLKNRYLIFF